MAYRLNFIGDVIHSIDCRMVRTVNEDGEHLGQRTFEKLITDTARHGVYWRSGNKYTPIPDHRSQYYHDERNGIKTIGVSKNGDVFECIEFRWFASGSVLPYFRLRYIEIERETINKWYHPIENGRVVYEDEIVSKLCDWKHWKAYTTPKT